MMPTLNTVNKTGYSYDKYRHNKYNSHFYKSLAKRLLYQD